MPLSIFIKKIKPESSKDKEKSLKSVKRESKQAAKTKGYGMRKPHTRSVNKLRLNARLRLNPTLKDQVINVDEDTAEETKKAQDSKIKGTKQRKGKKHSFLQEKVAEMVTARSKKSKKTKGDEPRKIYILVEVVEALK